MSLLVQVRAEKPAWYLAVISGALLRTLDFVAARSAEYLGYLEKGQLPPARLTLTAFEESFVLDGEAPCLPVGWRNMKACSQLCKGVYMDMNGCSIPTMTLYEECFALGGGAWPSMTGVACGLHSVVMSCFWMMTGVGCHGGLGL